MKSANLMIMSAAMALATSTADAANASQELIGKSEVRITDGRMTPEALWAMGRMGGVSVSPDNKKVVYTVAYYSVPQNKSNREIFIMNADGSMNITTSRLTMAPLAISVHSELIISMSEYMPTPNVAAKKLSALTTTEGIDVE